ncbi:phosphoglycerate dehydrogenase [Aliarcobacter butzleri]|uniref:phosphoglycerate dehydrogenase n=1 Tax=Aliarcobacter butzleri TaxID=28197 RepID=UPI00263CB2B9|nr:phosphoglycerate dehydrogenase [Aliarcobacter butzleri]MDN5098610.1 phosphoglycerate dehydrogenase [Aliarcobacter butzleri]
MHIAVTSPSFSSNNTLQQEIYKYFPNAKLNLDGKRFNKEELVEYIKNADAIIVGLEQIDEEVLEQCQNLKIVSKYGVGLNNIDLEACKKRDITIGWTGGVNKLSVAEMTLGYMLMLCRNLFITSNELKNGIWNKSGGFQLSEKRIGIIGVGYIGKELIRLLKPFNCEILVNDIINQEQYYKENNLKEVSKEEIFKTCDIVTIHTPFDSTTDNLINKKIFETMKNGSFIINSARGGIINEDDLKYALLNNLIAGAAVDTYVEEPPSDKELLSLPNLICTPHIGGNSREAVEAMGLSAINHLKEFYNL